MALLYDWWGCKSIIELDVIYTGESFPFLSSVNHCKPGFAAQGSSYFIRYVVVGKEDSMHKLSKIPNLGSSTNWGRFCLENTIYSVHRGTPCVASYFQRFWRVCWPRKYSHSSHQRSLKAMSSKSNLVWHVPLVVSHKTASSLCPEGRYTKDLLSNFLKIFRIASNAFWRCWFISTGINSLKRVPVE